MKLERRLIRLSVGVLLLGVVLHLALLLAYEQSTYRDRILQDLRGRAEILALNSAAAISFDDARAADENLQTLRTNPSVTLACLYGERGRIVATYRVGSRSPCPPLEGVVQIPGAIRHVEPIRVQSQTIGHLLLQERLPSLAERLPRYGLMLSSSIAVEALLVLVMVLTLRARVIQPVNELAALAAHVTEARDYAQRIRVHGNDEISELGTAVNRMLAAIEERAVALRESAQLLQALIDHAPATITMKGGDGRYLLVNEQFARQVGQPAERILGQRDDTLFPPQLARLREELDHATVLAGSAQRHEEEFGDRTWLTERFALRNTAGEIYAVSAISTDITDQRETQASLADALARLTELNESLESRVAQRTTELKQAMEQLVQSEKLAALGSLVAGIAHELNTPIGMVVTASSSMADLARSFSAQVADNRVSRSGFQRFLDDLAIGMSLIENNSLRAGSLINDFKQVAVDQTSMRRRSFQLDELIDNTLHALGPLFKHSQHRIESRVEANLECDSFPGAIEQILTNLIQNALIHGLANHPGGLIELEAHRDGDAVVLELSDNGCGIASQHLAQIFNPFFTTRLGEGGSGLGLYIVHNLAGGILGGKIEAFSTEGAGARFRLSFPLVAPRRVKAPN
ncbi:ATP-binding protein [Niveibacterium sp. COAC-50]|uniref:ATP-binding protein n=1 Tax=Niveibacterium sp. COAC-50 TaxID=2729384 RepID=UPI001556E816|nr:ATP-binding protein [Niveibacterium sp. COAC-50]